MESVKVSLTVSLVDFKLFNESNGNVLRLSVCAVTFADIKKNNMYANAIFNQKKIGVSMRT